MILKPLFDWLGRSEEDLPPILLVPSELYPDTFVVQVLRGEGWETVQIDSLGEGRVTARVRTEAQGQRVVRRYLKAEARRERRRKKGVVFIRGASS